MQIKRFRAHDMTEALKLIKKEFGSQAVILSAKEMKNGSGMLGFMKGPCVEVTAATDTDYPEGKNEDLFAGKWRLHRGVAAEPVSIARRAWKKPISLIKREAEILGIGANPAVTRNHQPGQRDMEMNLFDLSQEMQNQGVKENIALDLIKELDAAGSSNKLFKPENIKPDLIGCLEKMGVATKSLQFEGRKQKVIAMIGPTGVGKTTTIAKLAAIRGLAEKKTIGLITLDDRRIGAIAQLEVYARILGAQMEVALSKEGLNKSIKKLRKKDIILIDTPGISLKDTYQLRELKDLLDNVRHVEIHLLLSAVTKEKDFIRLLEKFSVMPIDSLIFTKLDESSEYGDLLNQLVRTKMPVSYFTTGPQVPEDMEVATLEKLVDLILLRKEQPERRYSRSEQSTSDGQMQRGYGPYLRQSYA